jgi:multidrug efflux pump subunit AcrB
LIPFLERFFSRRFVLNLLAVVLLALGGWAWKFMPVEMSPLPEMPVVTVMQSWGKTSAVVMEQKITRGIESIAYQLPGVEGVRSVTREGVSTVIITFSREEPVDLRVIELRERLYEWLKPLNLSVPVRIERSIPEELQQTEWFMRYTLRYEGSVDTLQHIETVQRAIRTVVQPGLLRIEGLAGLAFTGLPTATIQVHLLGHQLRAQQLEADAIIAALRGHSSFSGSSGPAFQFGHHSLTLRPPLTSLAQLKAFTLPLSKPQTKPLSKYPNTPNDHPNFSSPLSSPSANPPLRLDQIADIRLAESPPTVIYRVNGQPAYGMHLYKVPGYDALSLSNKVKASILRLQAELPKGMVLRLESDTAEVLQQQLKQLRDQALLSVSLVFLCVWVVYKRWKAPFIVLGCILMTFSITVIGMRILELTIHRLTLSALMISIGLVVDNAILVYDQLHRSQRIGGGSARQRLQALVEVFTPILGSTLTTVVIVLPLLFSLGSISRHLAPLVLTLSLALVISAFVSLVLIPHALKVVQAEQPVLEPTTGRLSEGATQAQGYVTVVANPGPHIHSNRGSFRKNPPSWRRRLKAWSWVYYHWRWRHRYYLLTGLVLLIGFPVYLIPEPGLGTPSPPPLAAKLPAWLQGYFHYRSSIDPWIGGLGYRFYRQTYFGQLPIDLEQDHLRMSIKPPLGTPIERLDDLAASFEHLIASQSSLLDRFETIITETGGAHIALRFKPEFVDHTAAHALKNELMQRAAITGNMRIALHGLGEGYLSESNLASASFWIRMRGYAFDELRRQAGYLKNVLEQHPKVRHVETHQAWQLTDRGWQYVMELDPEAMLHHQLQRGQLMAQLEDEIQARHLPIGVLQIGHTTLPVQVYVPSQTAYLEEFLSLRQQAPRPFELSDVATLKKEQVMPHIEKDHQSYSLVLGVDFMGSYAQGNAVVSQVLNSFPRPLGFSIEQLQQKEIPEKQDSGLNELGTLLLAILCVWMVVAALFNDLRASMKVLAALPLAFLGIMSGALMHEIPFDRGAVAGTLLCIGIVVNNSILLTHRAKQCQSSRIFGFRAWIRGYRSSLRSILLTSGTTLLGLLPVLVWGEAGFWYHMAVVVSWGLAYSVVLLLAFSGMMTR